MKTLIRVFDNNYNFMNVIVPLSMDFDKVIYIYHHKVDKRSVNSCTEILKKYKNNIEVDFKFINDDEKEITSLLNDNCVIDISIARYLSAFLFDKALNRNLDIVYFDNMKAVIKDYKTHSIIVDKLFSLTIDDMLILGGGKINNKSMHKEVDLNDKELVETIENVVENNIDKYSAFTNFVQKVNSFITHNEGSKNTFILSDNIKNKIINDDEYIKNKKYELFKIEDNKLIFRNEFIRNMFYISGSFLENYVYIKLAKTNKFDQIYMSKSIDFSNDEDILPINCELDCLAICNNHLLFISCKSNKVITDDLNEIKIHDSIFGNVISYPVICTLCDLSKEAPSEYLKAKQLGIKVIDKTSFIKGTVGEDIASIINNAYKYEKV